MAFEPQILAVAQGGTGLASTTANQILYSSSANTIAGLATANNAVLATDGSGVPSITATPRVTSITFDGANNLANYVGLTAWTPTVGGSSADPTSVTYSVQEGEYTRIGNMVWFQFTITLSALTIGAASGSLEIRGLPFTASASNANINPQTTIALANVTLQTLTKYATADVLSNTTKLNVVESQSAGAFVATAVTSLSSTSRLNGSGWYSV